MAEWEQDFDAYVALLDDAPASFMLDLAAHAHAPLASHPARVQVRVTMKSPRDDGLRAADEADALGLLEDRIIDRLEQHYDALFIGHTISEGLLHIVTYAPEQALAQPKRLLDGLDGGGYEVVWFVEHDPDWDMYFEFLYPDVRSMQIIQNRRLMKIRAEHGDDPSRERVIDHTASFEDRAAAAAAAEALATRGFSVDPVREEGELWLLEFRRADRLDQDCPDSICLEIIDLLEAHAGDYEGWGAPVLRSELH